MGEASLLSHSSSIKPSAGTEPVVSAEKGHWLLPGVRTTGMRRQCHPQTGACSLPGPQSLSSLSILQRVQLSKSLLSTHLLR